MIKVTALDHVSLSVPSTDELTGFYVERWGLQLFERDPGTGTSYLRAAESGHHALSLQPADRRALHHIAFSVATQDDLKRAVDEALAAGVPVEREPGQALEPGHRESARLRDPDGNVVELVWEPEKVTDTYKAPVVTPRKLGHLVLNTPNQPAMEQFYRRLGFRVTDRTIRDMAFMRSTGGDHHTLALVKSTRTGIQHVAYDVAVLDNVMRALGAFKSANVACLWGPGRHGPGNNIFTYYADPAGTIIEYYAEIEQVQDQDEEQLEERFWGPEHSGDQWGVAGPAPAAFRGE